MLIPTVEVETYGHELDPPRPPNFDRFLGKRMELVGLKKDGTAFPIDLSISQVDHLGIFTGIIRDISENKQLQKQVLEIAEVEQRRIGQELHDGTGQELTGLALFAGTVADLLRDAPKPSDLQAGKVWSVGDSEMATLQRVANRLTTGLAEAIRHVQKLSHGILPVQIEPDGLASALSELAASTNEFPNVECAFECPERILINDNAVATHLYRIAQESVNNALKHGNPHHVRISMDQNQNLLRLQIDDDGSGFELSESNKSVVYSAKRGFGLDIMRYRAGMIGGSLLVSKNVSGGMTICCTIPTIKVARK
jgi:signal transduction histidine kinase